MTQPPRPVLLGQEIAIDVPQGWEVEWQLPVAALCLGYTMDDNHGDAHYPYPGWPLPTPRVVFHFTEDGLQPVSINTIVPPYGPNGMEFQVQRPIVDRFEADQPGRAQLLTIDGEPAL